MRNSNKAFTLTELLITIAIIGIMAAIALPRYMQGEVARTSEAISQLSAIHFAEANYRIDNGAYIACPIAGSAQPACWATMGVDNPALNPQAYFSYEVLSASPNTTFCAIAKRIGSNIPELGCNGASTGCIVCMDNNGAYSGNHPYGPRPGAAAAGTGCASIC